MTKKNEDLTYFFLRRLLKVSRMKIIGLKIKHWLKKGKMSETEGNQNIYFQIF